MKRTFNHTLTSYKKNSGGNVGMMFAFGVLMLIALLAVAVDLTNSLSAKQRLQDTTDAVALLAAKDKSLDTVAKLEAAAQSLYDATYPGERGTRIEIESIQRDGDQVTVITKNNVDTYFSEVFNTSNLDIGVTSTATISDKAMDVALVLDTTFSMTENNKIGNLKMAASGLLDTFDELNNENVRVSVVPFSEYVNVGTSRRNEVWLDVPANETVCRTRRDVTSRTNCRRVQRTCTNDGVSFDCSFNQCDRTFGPEYQSCSTVAWNGCVGSRVSGYDERAGYDGRKIPGLTNVSCATELQPLDDNISRAKATVSGLTARHETYIPAGVLWGWRTLDETDPLSSNGANVKADREKVMIVMTDGENQRSKNGIRHDSNNINAANAKTDAICTEAKRDGVTIYTIAYDVNDTATKNLLTRCATDGSKFFDAGNASELNNAFQAIGEALSDLRISA